MKSLLILLLILPYAAFTETQTSDKKEVEIESELDKPKKFDDIATRQIEKDMENFSVFSGDERPVDSPAPGSEKLDIKEKKWDNAYYIFIVLCVVFLLAVFTRLILQWVQFRQKYLDQDGKVDNKKS